MSAAYDRSAIMKAAHFTARWRVQSVGGSYREWFAKALCLGMEEGQGGSHARGKQHRAAGPLLLRGPSRASHASMPSLHHAFRPHRRIVRGLIKRAA